MSKASLVIEYVKQQLNSFLFKCEYRTAPQYFTRESPLNFHNIALIILNLVKKTIKVELMNFFSLLDVPFLTPSRQAFEQAREKVSYLVFKDFFDKTCSLAVTDPGAKTYNGYRIFAVDGTSFVVGDFDKLHSYFGETTTVPGKSICRIGGMVDVLSEEIVSALVSPFSTGERSLTIRQIDQLSCVTNALYLLDRGYWSKDLVKDLCNKKLKFLMRLPSNALPCTHHDGCKSVKVKGTLLRTYSFLLPNGVRETLLTNLPTSEISDAGLAELYTKRWGIETKYLELKSRLQIDSLSGNTVNAVLQDIYSTLFISNLVAFICEDVDTALELKSQGKNLKYEQKANRAICIAAIRAKFIYLCLFCTPEQAHIILDNLTREITRCVTYKYKSLPRPRGNLKHHVHKHHRVAFL